MQKKEKSVVYEPVVGLTIMMAILEAIKLAKDTGKPVRAVINDIEMNITAKTNAKRAETLYQKRNQAKYEAEVRAYEQQLKKRQSRGIK